MTTTRDHWHQALLVELRKSYSQQNHYRVRKFRERIRAYDYGFRDGNGYQYHPDFDGTSISQLANGKATRLKATYPPLDYAEARFE